jgi:serine/threonine protein kinase
MQIIFGISMADAKMLRRCECYKRPMRMLKADADEHWPMRKVIFPVVCESYWIYYVVDKLIGKGGTSRVYKANFPEGRELAVKMLKPSKAALKEFICEMQIVSCLRHTNIISLAGFCFENKSLILMYNYLSNGSLEEILHGMLFLPLLLFLHLKCVYVTPQNN